MNKPQVLFMPTSVKSHIIPALYLADLLLKKYEVFILVTSNSLKELVETNGHKTVLQ